MKTPARITCGLAVAFVLASSAFGQSGEIVDLSDTIPAPTAAGYTVGFDKAKIWLTGLNDAREISGWYQFDIEWTEDGQQYTSFSNGGFVWRNGGATDIGRLGPDVRLLTTAEAINNDGVVVGAGQVYYETSQGTIYPTSHAFIHDGGFTDLMDTSLPEVYQLAGSGAFGINTLRHVVGTLGYSATRWIGSSRTGIGVLPNYYRSFATAVNDSGVVVGAAYKANLEYQAFRYTDAGGLEGLTALMDPDCCSDFAQTFANDIGQDGTIVGWGIEFSGKQALIWKNNVGTRLRLDPYAVSGSEAMAINSAGQVVGRALTTNGNPAGAYIWLPRDNGTYEVKNLNEILPANSPWVLLDAVDINNNGEVIGHGLLNGVRRPYLLQTGFGLTVNSIGDDPDFNDTDGNGVIEGAESGNSVCDTGNTITRSDGSIVPECTLRAALSETNFKAGKEFILFDIDGSGVRVISPKTPLPPITDPVVLNGYSQPGSMPNTSRDGFDGLLLVALSGRLLPQNTAGTAGLEIVDKQSIIRGLIISGFPGSGIAIRGDTSSANVIAGNRIGLGGATISDLEHPAADSGNGLHGVLIVGAPANVIGGSIEADRNVISLNQGSGIRIEGATAADNYVLGNLIGTDSTGAGDAGNAVHGVSVQDAPTVVIGSAASTMRNVIAGNDSTGVSIAGPTATGAKIERNYVGVDASGAGDLANSSFGILISEAPGATIGGDLSSSANVVSGNLGDGIVIVGAGASGASIRGNTIGANAAVTADLSNGGSGIRIDGAPGAVVGGDNSSDGNVIAGNAEDGVRIEGVGASGTIVKRNVIGANRNGDIGLGNSGNGVAIDGANQVEIGGTAPGDANFIAGSGFAGILIEGPSATGNLIQGNTIGADSSNGTSRSNLYGVIIEAASDNTIGGEDPAAANFIAYQRADGVRIVSGTGNRILGNAISHSGGLPINLDNDGVAATLDTITPNDDGDGDTGANDLQNHPELRILGQAATDVQGTLRSKPSSTYRIEFFQNTDDPEGETYLASTDVQTDADGLAEFVYAAGSAADKLTTTATDALGNTSEFSSFPTRFAVSDLEVIKKVVPASASVGDTVGFTVRIQNNGPHQATAVTVNDKLPAGLNFVSAAVERGSYDTGSGVWDIGDIATDDSLSLFVTATVGQSGPIKNIATAVAGDQADDVPGNNVASAVVNAEVADISAANVVVPATANPGESVTFTMTVANTGPAASTSARLSAAAPVGLTYTNITPSQGSYDSASGTWSPGSIAASSSATLTVTARVDSAGMIVNTVHVVGADELDPNPTDNWATAVLNDDGSSTAALQRLIHAISSVDYDTVDVYIDSKLAVDNMAFRQTIEVDTLSPGPHELAVAPRSSTSVGDALSSATVDLTSGKTQFAFLFDDLPTGIKIVTSNGVPLEASNRSSVDVVFYNAVPDVPPLDFRLSEGAVGEGSLLLEDVALGSPAIGILSFAPQPYTFEFLAANSGNGLAAGDLVAQVVMDLSGRRGQAIAFVLSGLANPPSGYAGSHYINASVISTDGSTEENGSPVSIEQPHDRPQDFVLDQNFPNPFSRTTRVQFALPTPARTSLDVFDVLGKRVRVVVDGAQLPAGTHAVAIDMDGLAGGLYILRLLADDFSTTRTMVLVR